jgi:hypothetical protein
LDKALLGFDCNYSTIGQNLVLFNQFWSFKVAGMKKITFETDTLSNFSSQRG